jgi:hypothetical protein
LFDSGEEQPFERKILARKTFFIVVRGEGKECSAVIRSIFDDSKDEEEVS